LRTCIKLKGNASKEGTEKKIQNEEKACFRQRRKKHEEQKCIYKEVKEGEGNRI
jgi:hypothetical protein